MNHAAASQLAYHYHPFEIAICGYSGSGKTTLISKLLQALSPTYELGYLKHRAHLFQMDQAGKDTYIARLAGAQLVAIADGRHSAIVDASEAFPLETEARFLGCDGLIVEGGKELALAKIVMVDAERRILDELPAGTVALCSDRPETHPSTLSLPWFHRDNAKELAAWVEAHWLQQASAAPLNGLILSGGQSQRMGSDKGMLHYHGEAQIQHLARLLEPYCGTVFLSARPGQYAENLGLRLLEDSFSQLGPLAGILSAMRQIPQAAWLVVGCDMPGLDVGFMASLLRERQALRFASLAKTPEGLEPLAAIYEAKFYRQALNFLGCGVDSLQRILGSSRTKVFIPPSRESLLNINDPLSRSRWLAAQKSKQL